MGIYLNPGNRGFWQAVRSKIYVDKSGLISYTNQLINTEEQFLCVSRPRRFGKSMALKMLAAYYSRGCDSSHLFKGLNIENDPAFREHLNQYDVICLNMQQFFIRAQGQDPTRYLEQAVMEELREEYGELLPERTTVLAEALERIYAKTDKQFIFLIDEWDCVMRERKEAEDLQRHYLDFLRDLLKDQPYVELAYMTGVLPVAKYSSGSELNMFDEYNFMNDTVYDQFFGFSEEEVRLLCIKHAKTVSFEELKKWYDGYYFHNGESLFNPRSVVKALSRGVCLNYWTETGPMNEIANCIEHNTAAVREDLVKMTAGIPVEAELDGYSASELQLNTRNEILSAMVVYGFLAYYDGHLRIPNHELMEKYQRVLARDSMGEIKEIVDSSRDKVAQMLEHVHDREIPFLQYNDENALSCVVTLCYLYARKDFIVEREAKSGKGYCDYLFLPKKHGKPAIILELKVDDTCESAIAQIKSRNYLEKARKYASQVLLVGIGYDRTTKKHSCKIEKSE